MHLEAQFQCDHLVQEKSLFKKKEESKYYLIIQLFLNIFMWQL